MHTYTRVEWEDAPSTETPISAENLNHMDSGLIGAYQDIAELEQRLNNLSQQDASQMSVTFGEPGDTGVSDDLPLQTSPSTLRNIITSIHAQIRALAARTTPHIGMIIQSTTLDTEAKVIAVYGGEHWIQHTGYFLYAGNTGVSANNAVADGGEPMHALTVDEMPSHTHKVRYTGGNANGNNGGMPGTSVDATPGYNDLIIANEGGGQPHNNMPPYKKVYIWECVDAGTNISTLTRTMRVGSITIPAGEGYGRNDVSSEPIIPLSATIVSVEASGVPGAYVPTLEATANLSENRTSLNIMVMNTSDTPVTINEEFVVTATIRYIETEGG